MSELPKLALSIMQPWAWLIVNRHKAIENRDWPTNFRGTVAIHAGKKHDEWALSEILNGGHPVTGLSASFGLTLAEMTKGGIVGVADVVDCVAHSDSDWFVGRYGFVLANQRPVDFIPVKGALGFFDWRKKVIVPKAPEPARQGSLLS